MTAIEPQKLCPVPALDTRLVVHFCREARLSKHLLKSAATVGGLTLVSRIMGFVRDLVIARYFGADAGTDAFFVAFKIPNLLRRLFAEGTFSQAFVPVLSDYRAHQEKEVIRTFMGRTLGTLGLVLGLLSMAGSLAAPLLILLFAPGFTHDQDQFGLSVDMLRVTFPYLFFIGLTAFSGGVLNTWGHFAIPSITPVFLNVVMIASILWLSPHLSQPVMALAYGALIAGALQLAIQMPALWGRELLPRPRLGWSDPGVRRIFALMAPAVLGASVSQVNLLINTFIASFLVSGSVSWLYYSDRLVEFPLGIFGIAVGTVILPHLAKDHASGNPADFSRSLDWGLRWMGLVGIPATLGLLLLAKPIMLSLFQYEHFSLHDAAMASRSLMAYALGLAGFIAVKILLPGFSARHDLVTPARYGIYSVGVNILSSLLLVFGWAPAGWAHAGLALAASLAAVFNAGLLLRKLLHDGIYRPEPGWQAFSTRLALASVAMTVLLLYAAFAFPWENWPASARLSGLSITILLGVMAYGMCLWLSGLRPRHLMLPDHI